MFVLEGTLESGGFLSALRSISGGKLRGLLAVQGDQDLVSMTFIEGKIVAVDAMNRPMEEALSEVLAARGLVAPRKFSSVVDPVLGTGRLAGDVLLEEELIERGDLLDAVREQVLSQALQLLRWEQGIFSWSVDAESPFQKGMEPLSVGELLVRSWEEQDSGSLFGAAKIELAERFEANVVAPSYRVLGRDGDWIAEDDPSLWLTALELQVLEVVDAAQPAAHLLLDLGIESYELRYALQVLLDRSLINPAAGAEEKQASGNVRDLLGAEGEISDLLGTAAMDRSEADPLIPGGVGGLALGGEADFRPSDREISDLDLDRSLLEAEHQGRPALVQTDPLFDSLQESFRVDPDGGTGVVPRPEDIAQILSVWAARAMAFALVALLATQVFFRAQRQDLKFPFFWQARTADQLETKLWSATAAKIESALRVYHLLYGRFPDDLEILVDLQLLAPTSLYDARGRWLAYSMDGDGYSLRPAEGGRLLEQLQRRGGVHDDLFLDPRFVVNANRPETPGVRVVD